MKNRSPRDNTMTGIAENIAELNAIPGILIEIQDKIDSATKSLNELSAVEHDYADNKIPFSNRKITAFYARIKMLELPIIINAIKELVKKDEATIADALKVRSENEKEVQPYLDERKKIKQAIDLHTSLLSYKILLATASSTLTYQRAELSRLQDIFADLKQRRESAYAIETASKEKYECLDRDLQNLRNRHHAEEEPVIYFVNEILRRLESLKDRYQLALQCLAESTRHQHDEQNTARNHEEKSKHAYQDMARFLDNANAAHTQRRRLIADLEKERSAYERAKQAAEHSSNASGKNSSHDAEPPSTTSKMMTLPVGLGGFIQVPITPSPKGGYTSSQSGKNSDTSQSAIVADNGNILAGHLQKISELERGIQSAEQEAKRCEHKAVSEREVARNYEATAVAASQQAASYGEQARSFAMQVTLLQADIDRTNSEFTVESEKLRQMQQRMRNDDDMLLRLRDTAYNQHSNDVEQSNDLNMNVINTSKKIDDTNQSITNLIHDIESNEKCIKVTVEAIKACEYATRHSRETLEQMDNVQANLAEPYLKKIDGCNGIIRNTTTQKQSKENDISNHETKLRASTATVEQSKGEFAAICSNTDVPDLQKQLNAARSENGSLQQQLNTQREHVRSKQSELSNLRAEQDAFVRRQHDLQNSDLLMRLYENPAEQLRLLHADLLNSIKNYAETHHSGLNWRTRASLLTLTARANFIFNNDNVEGKTDNEKLRNKFYQLSGLLRHETAFVNNDPSYRDMLLSMFKYRDVEQSDVLQMFDQLAVNSQQQLRDMTETEVLNHDVIEYNRAKQAFDDLLALGPQQKDHKWRNFYDNGKRISACIHEQETRTRKPDEPEFDTHLHTKIFQLASVVLQHPDNALARTEMHALTQDNKIGQSSTARKVIGAILSFIGSAAALVGGLALASVIPGISMPIAAPMIVVGGIGVIGGIFTFFSGFQRGLSKAYNNFDHLAAGISSDMQTEPVRAAGSKPNEYHELPAPSAPKLQIL